MALFIQQRKRCAFAGSRIAARALLCLLVSINVVSAQVVDTSPLRPVDNSSPRDALQTFLDSVTSAMEAVATGNQIGLRVARNRARQLLDFSALENPYDWDVRTRHIIYLADILARVPPPPLHTVPDDVAVAAQGLERWTIPGTRIALKRIDEGPRAGEFVFSADTVAALPRYARQVAHLPYAGSETIGILADFVTYAMGQGTISSRVRERLRPVDASSPRALLQQFFVSLNAVHALMQEAETIQQGTRTRLDRTRALAMEREASALLQRAVRTLDLSDIPEALRQETGIEAALQLKEIFDRTALPFIESIPDARTVARMHAAGQNVRWTYPDTDIDIVEVTEGPRTGSFRFSTRTVDAIPFYYAKVKDLPYRDSTSGTIDDLVAEDRFEDEYDAPGVSQGLYNYYISTPGYLIPAASRFGPWLMELPDSMKVVFLGQPAWQWLGVLATATAFIVILYLLRCLKRWLSVRLGPPLLQWLHCLMPLLNLLVVVKAIAFVGGDLNVTGTVLLVVTGIGTALLYLFGALALYRCCVAVAETVIAAPRIADSGFDASLIRIGAHFAGFIAALYLLVRGVGQLGADVLPLLAGLGVGGLAVALAVRPTLENMIGGVILFADRPVRIGDFCTFSGQSGHVEQIGLRSTRIRALDRTLITVPNAQFADMQLINWARCDKMLIHTVIGLRYETTPEQLRYVLARLRQLCFAHPKIESDTLRIRLSGFGASSLDIDLRIYALTTEWNEYYAIREDVFLRVAEELEASGTGFAFPSQTLYLGRDAPLDGDKAAAAEREVARWRDAGELPFPLTPEPLASRLANTLDYPPVGSPGTGKRAAREVDEHLGSAR